VKNALGAKLASKCGIDIGPSIPIIEANARVSSEKARFYREAATASGAERSDEAPGRIGLVAVGLERCSRG